MFDLFAHGFVAGRRTPLSLTHFVGAFVFFGFGLFVGALAFASEYLIFQLMSQDENLLDLKKNYQNFSQ